jgi:hypothetical protein
MQLPVLTAVILLFGRVAASTTEEIREYIAGRLVLPWRLAFAFGSVPVFGGLFVVNRQTFCSTSN